ncbi:MAG: tRNA uridine-5-carboxymethylaminomethyl(34) synthesis enzyme MnmG [Clostridia bacterium]|nr:tRNA uridine-5-carboxymethylaminomethyl(34) synthesis enzyme MnmG [Clostridia bacterium]MBQ8819109.1 tRNA uridine-5-carboxymethylaminomethyl(34) synthesis enzyme MnmG [Clostridia bacterium]
MSMQTEISVIGAGHAGIEAALAAARTGIDTVLFTMSFESIANMPCNPSIGGTGKGHLVYEIDALGGEMGRAADKVTLQSRTLNLGKGAAVHSKRIQADRKKYQAIMKQTLENTPNLRVVQAEIVDIGVEDGKVTHVITKIGEKWKCKCAIICSGTYLDSRIFIGDVNYESGPDGFLASKGLSASLAELGIKLLRFKTGTPSRVKRSSIDFSELEVQEGEERIIPYSVFTDDNYFDGLEQIPCHVVYTNSETHRIIRDNIHRSAMYSGQIHGTGPRYCPSIEDKLTRFADKERHQLFVEPVGADTEEMYIQGFSTSLPVDVQHQMLASLKGFDKAEIMRYAYAIEYDCIDPTQLLATLEFKSIKGLYGAGQFNGTSGYEEAAAQGLIAGLNASLSLRGKEPLILRRSDSYIGTLIDDLVTKGTNEPYRMMTSRSEYRLLLRQDNADIRLTQKGYDAGLVTEQQYAAFCEKKRMIDEEIERLNTTFISPSVANPMLEKYGLTTISTGFSLSELLKRPQLTYEMIKPIDKKRPKLPIRVVNTVEVTVKYEGYIKRQISEVERHEKLEVKRLSPDIDYMSIKGLRIEAAQKLTAVKPLTVGQASRISGVNPADISVLLIYLGMK